MLVLFKLFIKIVTARLTGRTRRDETSRRQKGIEEVRGVLNSTMDDMAVQPETALF